MSNILLLYKNVAPLSRDLHRNLKLKQSSDLSFAANTHWVPIAGAEFYQAALAYPILFLGEKEGDKEFFRPIALLGLKEGRNDYLMQDQKWAHNNYLPAFIRRYPFVLANKNANEQEFTVCFDDSFEALNEKEGQRLFNEDGKNSVFLDEIIQFVNGFHLEMERTQKFVEQLTKLDLLEKRTANIRSKNGAVFQIESFFSISEEKFSKLDGDTLHDLHHQGYLGWIFAHLMSLSNLPTLLEMHIHNQKNTDIQ